MSVISVTAPVIAQREQREPDDRELGGREDDAPLVLGAELDAVVRGGRDQAGRRRGGQQQRDEVDRPLEGRDLREALVERDDEQEREQHLHARQRDPSSRAARSRLRSSRSFSVSSRPASLPEASMREEKPARRTHRRAGSRLLGARTSSRSSTGRRCDFARVPELDLARVALDFARVELDFARRRSSPCATRARVAATPSCATRLTSGSSRSTSFASCSTTRAAAERDAPPLRRSAAGISSWATAFASCGDLLLEELRHALLLAADAARELRGVLVADRLRERLDAGVDRDLLELVVVLGPGVLQHLLGLARAAQRVERALRRGHGLAGHRREPVAASATHRAGPRSARPRPCRRAA